MPATVTARPVIESYGGGGFRVGGVRHGGSLLVLPERCIAWPVVGVEDITLDSLAALWADGGKAADLVLIGGGAALWPVPPDLRLGLKAKGLVVEAMDTGAACRTYNVLLAEQRRVAAAILAID